MLIEHTLGAPGYLPIYAGGTRVPTRYTLGVPGYLLDILWGYPATYPLYSGGYPGTYPTYSGGTKVPTRCALGTPRYLPEYDEHKQLLIGTVLHDRLPWHSTGMVYYGIV